MGCVGVVAGENVRRKVQGLWAKDSSHRLCLPHESEGKSEL